jgi:hypothetical protein
MKRVKLSSARAIGQPIFSYFQYPRNMWAANRTSSPWVSPERAVPVMGQIVPHYVTACFISSLSTTSYAMYTELLSSREVRCTTTEPNGSRRSSVIVVTTCRAGHDPRMQVRFLAEGQRFSCSVPRADRAGGLTEPPTRLRTEVHAPWVK